MKIIPKLQNGGGFSLLFTMYRPVESPQSNTPQRAVQLKKSDSDEDKGRLTEKDLFLMLKELDGLPNDMRDLVQSLSLTLDNARLLGRDGLSEIATTYLSNLYKLKSAKYNKSEYDNAYEIAKASGGLNEIAITPEGKLIVLDKNNKIHFISPEDYIKSEGLSPITNSNLLWLRANDNSFTNNNKVFLTVENSIGMSEVDKMIRERFVNLGNTEESTSGYILRGEKGNIIAGAKLLMQLAEQDGGTLEGLYKTTITTKTLQNQINAALKYIYQTLPKNALILLGIKASLSNLVSDDGRKSMVNGALEVIGNMIIGTTTESTKYDTSYLGGTEKVQGKTTSTKKDIELNTAAKWLSGYGDLETMIINPGSSNSFMIRTNTMPLVKMSGDYLGANTSLLEVSEGLFGSILDAGNASMGMSILDPTDFSHIIVSDGKITSIDFPCIEINGTVVPDLSPDTRTKKNEADELIRSYGIDLNDRKSVKSNYQTINQIYESKGLSAAYDSNGDIIPLKWRRFGVMNGYADGRSLGSNRNNTLISEVLDDYKAENIITTIKSKDKNYESNRGGWSSDAIYQGTIWIPVKTNYHSALANNNMGSALALALEERDLAYETANRLILGKQPPQ